MRSLQEATGRELHIPETNFEAEARFKGIQKAYDLFYKLRQQSTQNALVDNFIEVTLEKLRTAWMLWEGYKYHKTYTTWKSNQKQLSWEKQYDDIIKLAPLLTEALQWMNHEEIEEFSSKCKKKHGALEDILIWLQKKRESKIDTLKEQMHARLEIMNS